MTASPVAVAAVPCGLVAGYLATEGAGWLPLLGGSAAALWLVLVAPPRVVLWVAGAGALVSQGSWPLVTSIIGGDVYLGDLLALGAVVAALTRTGLRSWWRGPLVLVALLVGWAVLRSAPAGEISFARIMLPLVVMLVVVRALPDGHDLRRDLRWFPLAVLVSIPLLDALSSSRASSIAGGPNETALIGGLGVVLAVTYRGLWRVLLAVVGGLLLTAGAGVTALVATAVALIVYSVSRGAVAGRRGRVPPIVAAWAIVAVAAVVPILRPDVWETIHAHLFQASKTSRVLAAGDPVLGSGWANVDQSAFFDTDVSGLHNVYLDFLAQLGAVGLTALVAMLVLAWRRGDSTTRALLVLWAVWVNTTGAFPGSAWGVLGFVLACAVLSDQVAEERDDDALRGAGRRDVDADLDHAARGR